MRLQIIFSSLRVSHLLLCRELLTDPSLKISLFLEGVQEGVQFQMRLLGELICVHGHLSVRPLIAPAALPNCVNVGVYTMPVLSKQ